MSNYEPIHMRVLDFLIKFSAIALLISIIGQFFVGWPWERGNKLLEYESNKGDLYLVNSDAYYNQEEQIATISYSTNEIDNKFCGGKISISYLTSSGQTVFYEEIIEVSRKRYYKSGDTYRIVGVYKDKENAKELIAKYGDLEVKVNIEGIAYATDKNIFYEKLDYWLTVPLILLGLIIFIPMASNPGHIEWKRREDIRDAKNRYSRATARYEYAKNNTNIDYVKNYRSNDMRTAKENQASALADLIKHTKE